MIYSTVFLECSRLLSLYIAIGAFHLVAAYTIMQTCWPNHHQHPWFVSPTLKRKLSAEEDQPDGEQQRRKRLHKLERGFAELTLHRASASPDLPASTSVIHPNSIEEPQDIKMSSGSWYEPEKDRKYISWRASSIGLQLEQGL